MSSVEIRREDCVAEVLLARNALNTLSPDFVVELSGCLVELAQDDDLGALVLGTTAPKFFSAGWDLPVVKELGREDMAAFLASFNRLTVTLATLPFATVAAVSGFAVAGGAILALACDWRVMTNGKGKLGMNEVDLGVPLPLPAALLVQAACEPPVARDVMFLGRLYSGEEALAAGLVDALAAPEAVASEARGLAAQLASKPRAGAAAMKAAWRAPMLSELELRGHAHEEGFLRAWFSPAVRPFLADAAARLVPR